MISSRLAAALPSVMLALYAGEALPAPEEKVLERLEAYENWRAEALREYEVYRRYVVEGARFGQNASMDVRVSYSFPGRKDAQVLRAEGSRWLRTRVLDRVLGAELDASRDELRAESRLTRHNYDMRVTGRDSIGGRPCFIVEISPRRKKGYLVRGRIWVDAADAAVVKLEGEPVSDGSFWIRNVHIVQAFRKIGPFWLIDSMHTQADVRIFGPAHLSISCQDYQINETTAAAALLRMPARL